MKDKKESMGIQILKRNGELQEVNFEKIHYRLKKLVNDKVLGKLDNVDFDLITQKTIQGIKDGISSSELDLLSADHSIQLSIEHPEYGVLGARILISNLHKNTTECFSSVMESLYKNKNKLGEPVPLLSDTFIKNVRKYKSTLNDHIDYSRDYLFTPMGFKTLEKAYLFRTLNKNGDLIIAERPAHLWMRVALAIHSDESGAEIDLVLKSYDLMSQMYFTHASPTLFNAGKTFQSMSSCYVSVIGDSMEEIYKTLSDCALISKRGGGIGLSISEVRAGGSHIKGTNGKTDGIKKICKVYNETSRLSNQGNRPGSFAIYLEPWHADIIEFLELRLNTGKEENRARDLFYGLWVNDLFMKAVEEDSNWYLMSSDTNPGLVDAYGEDFEKLYKGYVDAGNYRSVVKARTIWDKILDVQTETGMPYMCYKDTVNKMSNQKNVGTIKSSNLCAEEVEYTDSTEFNVCNISTVSLPKFIETNSDNSKFFNYQKLFDIVQIMTVNMNKVIDHNYYPIPETEKSNLNHRPVILGTQGVSSVFFELKIPFESVEASQINKDIFETIQYASLDMSCKLARKDGKYSSFDGSPASKGLFQHNMYGKLNSELSGRWDWDSLKKDVMKYGLRNSLLTGSPPTASTSQILGNYESFEPIGSNLFVRSLLSGQFPIVNKSLVDDLMKINLWTPLVREKILHYRGSIQQIDEIPQDIRKLYKTVWEISQKVLMNMSADRQLFTDQSQSLNLYMETPTRAKLTSMHFHGWKSGLKTGMYYLRSQPVQKAEAFTVSVALQKSEKEKQEALICSIENKDSCMMCSG
jgi:ribonucleoside-diphosphate reductase alpha chain